MANNWKIKIYGDLKKVIDCDEFAHISMSFWDKPESEFIVRSVYVYPTLRQLVIYVTKR